MILKLKGFAFYMVSAMKHIIINIEPYMIVNFRTRGISTRKLIQTPTLIIYIHTLFACLILLLNSSYTVQKNEVKNEC